MAGNNPRGRESQDTPGRDEGFLFHSAWANHQFTSFLGWGTRREAPGRSINGATCEDLRVIDPNAPIRLGLGARQIFAPSARARDLPARHRALCPGPPLFEGP